MDNETEVTITAITVPSVLLGIVLSLLQMILAHHFDFPVVGVTLPSDEIDLFQELLLVILQLANHVDSTWRRRGHLYTNVHGVFGPDTAYNVG